MNFFNVGFSKALNETNYEERDKSRTYNSVSVEIAAVVLSYARIHISKIKLYIL